CVGGLYAVNTFGAVVGIFGSAFVVMPVFGLHRTAWLLAVVNVLCGVVALLVGSRAQRVVHSSVLVNPVRSETEVPDSIARNNVMSRRELGLTVFCTGLLGIGFETVGVRVLSQVLENTIYTFASVLAVFLLGTCIGAALYQRLLRDREARPLLSDLVGGVS